MARGTKKKPKGISGILLDENMPRETAEYLTAQNYKVQYPPKGMLDHQVFQLAKRQGMVVVTQDRRIRKHVSSLRHPGIIIIQDGGKFGPEGVNELLEIVLSLFSPLRDIADQIIEISRRKLSITLPVGAEEIEIPLEARQGLGKHS